MHGYDVGINLGGWLSQYGRFSHDHFRSFITQADIRQIASWGMDHVRLPVDYPVLEDDAEPGQYKESGFAYIDNCLAWCKEAGLNMVLDLHHAPGFSFTTLDKNNLFHSPAQQERFIRLWEAIARRYRGVSQPGLVLEFLNEVVLPSGEPWNELAQRTFERVRAIDPTRWVMMGGNHYNSVNSLPEIRLFDDPYVIYTFHCYDPMPFTHQRAHWVAELKAFNAVTGYPGKVEGLAEFLAANPQYKPQLAHFLDVSMDKDLLEKRLQLAVEFIQRTGKPLYCGEYGAIEFARLPDRIRWHRDFVALLRKYGIARAVWSYKLMDFSLVDGDGKPVSEELIKVVSQK
jgi:endoglucanase